MRPADDKNHPNLRVYKPEEGDIQEFQTKADVVPIERLSMPSINPHKIVGEKFITTLNRDAFRAEVKEHRGDDKFLVQFGEGDHEEILTYNYVLDMINNRLDTGDNGYLSFEDIIDHQVNKKRKYEILIKWCTGETTWEPLNVIRKS